MELDLVWIFAVLGVAVDVAGVELYRIEQDAFTAVPGSTDDVLILNSHGLLLE